MKTIVLIQCFGAWLLVSTILFEFAHAITLHKKSGLGFITKRQQISAGLQLPTTDKLVQIRPKNRTLQARVSNYGNDKRVEPLYLYLPKKKKKRDRLIQQIAKPNKRSQLENSFEKIIDASGKKDDKLTVKIILTPKLAKLTKISAFGERMQKKHHEVNLDSSKIKNDKPLKTAMLGQLRGFLPKSGRKKIRALMNKGAMIPIEKYMLPDFPKKMIRRYLRYRGPNCFQAALGFHGRKFTFSPMINVKKETGYHRAMINYDELWRAIKIHFYEVNPKKSALKYGDMLVFFSVPTDWKPINGVNFRWIRHTATYLFNEYTFSKGSKSPNTPYTIKTLTEEWKTWNRHIPNIGVKIFRKARPKFSRKPPVDLIDWIY